MPPAAKPDPKLIKPAPKTGKPWLLILAAVVVTGAGAGGAAWFFSQKSAEKQIEAATAKAQAHTLPAPALYFALEPAFVVNLVGDDNGAHYLQVEVQLMTRDAESQKAIEQHAPAIRARLLMLFSQQSASELVSRAGKEKLQASALAEARKLLQAETGKPGAEDLLFTSFVMQ